MLLKFQRIKMEATLQLKKSYCIKKDCKSKVYEELEHVSSLASKTSEI